MGYVPPVQSDPLRRWTTIHGSTAAITTVSFVLLGVTLIVANVLPIGGLPFRLLSQIWQDPITRSALLGTPSSELRERVAALELAAELRAYYRPRITNPEALDRQVHQILYNRLGYVGAAYRVSPQGQVVPLASQVGG